MGGCVTGETRRHGRRISVTYPVTISKSHKMSIWLIWNEVGATIPAAILLGFMDVTRVDPDWLLTDQGERYLGRGTADSCHPDYFKTFATIRRTDDTWVGISRHALSFRSWPEFF
jgi:hypothetical protein